MGDAVGLLGPVYGMKFEITYICTLNIMLNQAR